MRLVEGNTCSWKNLQVLTEFWESLHAEYDDGDDDDENGTRATPLAAFELSGYSKSSQNCLQISLDGNGISTSLIKPSSSRNWSMASCPNS